jgi:type II secretory pathway predicted ATPase ExeA
MNMVLHAHKGAQSDGMIVNPFAPGADIPDPYATGSRENAIASLLRGVGEREVLQVLSGPAHVGKSVVLSAVLGALARKCVPVVCLDNSYTARWSLRLLIGHILGRPAAGPIEREMAAAFARLSAAPAGELAIVVAVDDAQTLTDQALEYLLLIASLADRRTPLLQFILAGRGDFCDRRWPGEVAAMIAQSGVRVALEPFDEAEAADYVAYRLAKSGRAPGELATPSAIGSILQHAAGLPGQIDRIFAAAIDLGVDRFALPLTTDTVEQAVALLEPPLELPHPQMLARATASPPDHAAGPLIPDRVTLSPSDDAAATVSVPLPAAAFLARSAATIETVRTGHDGATDPLPGEVIVAESSSVQILAPRMVVSQELARPHVGSLMISLAVRRHPFRAGGAVAGCLAIGAFAVLYTHPTVNVVNAVVRQGATAGAPLTLASDTAAAIPTASSALSMTPVDGAAVDGKGQGATRASAVAGSATTTVTPSAGSAARPADDVSAQPLQGAPDDHGRVASSLSPLNTPRTAVLVQAMPAQTMPVQTVPVRTMIDSAHSGLAMVPGVENAAGTDAIPGGRAADAPSVTEAASAPADVGGLPTPVQPLSSSTWDLSSTADMPPVPPVSQGVPTVADVPAVAQPSATAAAAAVPEVSLLSQNMPQQADVPTVAPPSASATAPMPQMLPLTQNIPKAADIPAVASPSPTAVEAAVPEVPRFTATVPSTADVPAVVSRPAATAKVTTPAVATTSTSDVATAALSQFPPARDPPKTADVAAVGYTSPGLAEAVASPPASLPAVDATQSALARSAPPSALSPQIVAALLRRGDALLREGDVAAARLAYERAAAAGSGPAATGAGRTYDPVFLAGIDARGLQGDPVRAADWYRRALELGDGAAPELLKTLLARSGR